jgi:hypothetical protein
MQGWAEFYTVTAGAAATLMGLLFVVVSINDAAILGAAHQHSRRLAEQAFQNYVAVLSVSLLAVMPDMDTKHLGSVTLGITALAGVWVIVRSWLALTKTPEAGTRLQSLRRQFGSLLGFAILLFAATRMAFDLGDSRYSFAAAIMVLLAAATRVSWQLLLRMAETRAH